MRVRFYGSGVITILPKGPLAISPLIVLLACSTRDQLHCLWDYVFPFIIPFDKMNIVRGYGVVQDGDLKTFLCLKEPLQPSALILRKLQQEFLLVASMRDMPDITRKVVPIRSWQREPLKSTFWGSKMRF